MKIEYRKYQDEDFNDLVQCMEGLQDFLVSIDPLKKMRRLPGYGKSYANRLIKEADKQDGIILLAYDDKKIAGGIAGIIEKQKRYDLLEWMPAKTGRTLELFVFDDYRRSGIGKELMRQMEDYFKQNKCDILRTKVFEPNKSARDFYRKLNYSDRIIDMVKVVD